jgi:hypothetical protein
MNRVFKFLDELATLMENVCISPGYEGDKLALMPDPIRKEKVNLQLARAELAIRRRANLMGFETPAGYLTQMSQRPWRLMMKIW